MLLQRLDFESKRQVGEGWLSQISKIHRRRNVTGMGLLGFLTTFPRLWGNLHYSGQKNVTTGAGTLRTLSSVYAKLPYSNVFKGQI